MELRIGTERREVTPVELFFDLVYAFAISQLSGNLFAHPTWTGAAQTLVLYLAVYAAWAYTTWAVTLVPAENPRTRRMLLAVMLVGLFMNAAIPRAFEDGAWVFVIAFLLIHIGRTIWLLTVGLDEVNQEHFVRVLVWFLAAAPFWILGAIAPGDARLTWWTAAILIELAGTWTAHPLPGRRLDSHGVTFAGGHLLERGRLFMIIAFGETILATGYALSGAPYEPITLLTSAVALTGTVALFWLFFSRSDHISQRYEGGDDPMSAGRSGVISLMASVAGMIVIAVGDERVIAHPFEIAGITTNLFLFGGPGLFLAAQTWHRFTLFGEVPRMRLFALAALGLGCLATLTIPAYFAAAIAVAIFVTMVVLEDHQVPSSTPPSYSR